MQSLRKILRGLMGRTYRALKEKPKSSWEIYKDYVKIHPTAIIDPSASVKIFNLPNPPAICLEIGAASHIFATFSLLRPQSRIKIGMRCQLGQSSFICADSIEVGDDVLMAWGVTLMDNDSHSLSWEKRQTDVSQCYEDYCADRGNFIKNKDWRNVPTAPIAVRNRTWIGFNSSILKGVIIEEEAVIGAGSVVTKNIPPKSVAAGNPARILKSL